MGLGSSIRLGTAVSTVRAASSTELVGAASKVAHGSSSRSLARVAKKPLQALPRRIFFVRDSEVRACVCVCVCADMMCAGNAENKQTNKKYKKPPPPQKKKKKKKKKS